MKLGQVGIGDLVKLKSGGPVMCVMNINATTAPAQASCGWFNSHKEFWKEHFSLESLKKHAPRKSR